ncbi:MAG: hypothetical protein ACKO6O_06480 [Acidimicrobiaceae bacterium]
MKAIIVCERNPVYAAAIAHLLYIGIKTLALTQKQFENLIVKVVGKTDGWSPFCMTFFGECSYYDEYKPNDKESNVLYVLAYSSCENAKLVSAGLQRFATSILSLPLLESVVGANNHDFAKVNSGLVAKALVPAGEIDKYKSDFGSMEEEQVFLADCVYCALEVLQRVVVAV